ncbi:MAG: hypothetical protein RMJ16_09465 [Thermoguttaceae bacterium]|nr:hypothetical protein [Thermoguttaceae bacterium]
MATPPGNYGNQARRVSGVWVIALTTLGVVTGIVLWRLVGVTLLRDTAPPPVGPSVPYPEERQPWEQINQTVAKHTDWAISEVEQRINRYHEEVDQFFSDCKSRIPTFADEACSVWQYLTSSQEEFRWFVVKKFSEIVFSEPAFRELLVNIERRFVADLQSIENEMLVRIQADLGDHGILSDAAIKPPEFHERVAQIASVVVGQMPEVVTAKIAGTVASFVAGEVAAMILRQLAPRVLIWKGAAASGWYTFGIGLLAGFAMDAIISKFIQDEVRRELYAMIAPRLDEMCAEVVNGANGSPGLRERLTQIARDHFNAQKAQIVKALCESPHPTATL